MTIKEVEEKVGIKKANIRYYGPDSSRQGPGE